MLTGWKEKSCYRSPQVLPPEGTRNAFCRFLICKAKFTILNIVFLNRLLQSVVMEPSSLTSDALDSVSEALPLNWYNFLLFKMAIQRINKIMSLFTFPYCAWTSLEVRLEIVISKPKTYNYIHLDHHYLLCTILVCIVCLYFFFFK